MEIYFACHACLYNVADSFQKSLDTLNLIRLSCFRLLAFVSHPLPSHLKMCIFTLHVENRPYRPCRLASHVLVIQYFTSSSKPVRAHQSLSHLP